MTHLLNPSLLSAWSYYKISRPLTTRTGKLPGQRAEAPLAPQRFTDWLHQVEQRGVSMVWEDGSFVLRWPTCESYDWRDVERVRVNWSQLLTRFRLRTQSTTALPLSMLVSELPLVFLDTETTGTSGEDRVIELCCQGLDGQGQTWRFDPDGVRSNPMAFAVHGITDEELVGEPYFGQCIEPILDQLDGHVVVGHNVGFDVRMMKADFLRAGVEWEPLAQIDTVKLSRRLFPELPSHKLTALADHFQIKHLAAHTARGDVDTLRALWAKLIEKLPPTTTLQDLL